MKKTISITDVKRPIELPLENYEAHKEVVDHWCDGGEVEIKVNSNSETWELSESSIPRFSLHHEYHIKKREPQPGEVWTHSTLGAAVCYSSIDEYCMCSLRGDDLYKPHCFEYAAPSVEAYIARKILDEIDSKVRPIVINDYEFELNKAARLDEE